MQIEKNIAATLRKAMQEQGMTLMEFSTDMGIPRTTMQSYLNGDAAPRAGTLEFMAEHLGISVAALISGPEYSELGGISCLERVFLESLTLHPDARPIAKDALSVLRSAFRLSDTLLDHEAKTDSPETPEGRYQYIVHELWNPFQRSASFGLLVKERVPQGWITVALVGAFSPNKAAVARLAKKCTRLQLDPEQLLDVIHDFITAEDLIS